MNGKDLFEGLSFIDERYIDESENCGLSGSVNFPWLRFTAMAACLCLVMLSLWCLHPFLIGPYGSVPETTAPDDPLVPEGFRTVILHVEEMTDEGLIGTVAEQMIPELFDIGTELNVVIMEDTMHETADYTGCHVLVWFFEYDLDAAVITADIIEEVPPPDQTN